MLFPQFGVVAGFPCLHTEGGEVLHLPGLAAQVGGVCHADTAAPLHIAIDVEGLLASLHLADGQSGTSNGYALGASATEAEGSLALAHLLLVPLLAVVPYQAVLRHFAVGTAPVGGYVGASLGIGRHAGLVDEFTALGNLAGHFGIGQGDGQCIDFARRFLPRASAVGRAGIAEVMVGGHVGGLAPHPADMDSPAGIHVELPIGIALALAVYQDVLHTAPLSLVHIVAVHHQVAPARPS